MHKVPFLRRFSWLFLAIVMLSGCHNRYQDLGAPQPIPQYQPKGPVRPIDMVLVLGSGGSRGMAHVGVLEELDKANMKPGLIIGCSAGSIIGALYCDEPDAVLVKEAVASLSKADLLDYSMWNFRYGLVQGKGLRRVLKRSLRSETFEQLKIPLIVVATDLMEGELVTIGGGDLVNAVHASCAVPMYFQPVEAYGRILVDGAVVNPTPAVIARQYNPKIVVAVDLSALLTDEVPTNLFGVALRSFDIAFRHQSEHCLREADVVIRPEIGQVDMFDDGYQLETYEAGKLAARAMIPYIRDLMHRRTLSNRIPPLIEAVTRPKKAEQR